MDFTDFVFTIAFIVTGAVTAFCLMHFFGVSLLAVMLLTPVIAIPVTIALTFSLFSILSWLSKLKRKD